MDKQQKLMAAFGLNEEDAQLAVQEPLEQRERYQALYSNAALEAERDRAHKMLHYFAGGSVIVSAEETIILKACRDYERMMTQGLKG